MNTLYRQLKSNIIVRHNKNEIPYISVPHFHSQYEIYYNISGAKGFMLDGEFYKCFAHSLIVVPEISSHKVIVKKNASYERCIINIDKSVFENIEEIYHKKGIFDGIKKSTGMIRLTDDEHQKYMMLINQYINYEKNGDEILMMGTFMNIIAFIKELFNKMERNTVLSDEEISTADKIIKLVEDDFKLLTVSDIASKMYVNEDYLNRLFKDETGITLKKYLTVRKIAEAKKYIYLKKSVKEACFLSGFNDYANFLRTFKKYEGYTPKEVECLSEPI